MCNDYLVRKKAFVDYKNIDFRGLLYWIFSKRSTHDFGQKLEFSPLLVFGQLTSLEIMILVNKK